MIYASRADLPGSVLPPELWNQLAWPAAYGLYPCSTCIYSNSTVHTCSGAAQSKAHANQNEGEVGMVNLYSHTSTQCSMH